mmetsp:Transcript_73777/g.220143  ORF Transcript_73777/g.220143 Transcript_73777/m.220143 type:complete len:327 (+) Transcript_73777:132-1112(+)
MGTSSRPRRSCRRCSARCAATCRAAFSPASATGARRRNSLASLGLRRGSPARCSTSRSSSPTSTASPSPCTSSTPHSVLSTSSRRPRPWASWRPGRRRARQAAAGEARRRVRTRLRRVELRPARQGTAARPCRGRAVRGAGGASARTGTAPSRGSGGTWGGPSPPRRRATAGSRAGHGAGRMSAKTAAAPRRGAGWPRHRPVLPGRRAIAKIRAGHGAGGASAKAAAASWRGPGWPRRCPVPPGRRAAARPPGPRATLLIRRRRRDPAEGGRGRPPRRGRRRGSRAGGSRSLHLRLTDRCSAMGLPAHGRATQRGGDGDGQAGGHP